MVENLWSIPNSPSDETAGKEKGEFNTYKQQFCRALQQEAIICLVKC